MLATSFPDCLSVCIIAAVSKSGEKSHVSNYRGFTVGPVFAQLWQVIKDLGVLGEVLDVIKSMHAQLQCTFEKAIHSMRNSDA